MDKVGGFLHGEIGLDVPNSNLTDIVELSLIIDERREGEIEFGGSDVKTFSDYWKECAREGWEIMYSWSGKSDRVHLSANREGASESYRQNHYVVTAEVLVKACSNSFVEIKEDELMNLFGE